MNTKARLIAFYLPQFHPIPENDQWWGRGFTEWTNVAKAKPLFPGHYQPRLPADLGFYDLRVPETRAAQAELARRAGIEGFCYWHYWFGGKRLLERPFAEVLQSGEPDYPFCLGWANQTWTGIWHGAPKRVLIEQTYPGADDHERHFHAVLPAFLDQRYIRVNQKPLMLVYDPRNLPAASEYIEQWQRLAARNGLDGIHFVAHLSGYDPSYDPMNLGFDAVTIASPTRIARLSKLQLELANAAAVAPGAFAPSPGSRLKAASLALKRRTESRLRRWRGQPPQVFEYAEAARFFLDELELCPAGLPVYPCAVPNWDNSPRSGVRALILKNATPELFRGHFRKALQKVEGMPPENRIVFVKSWNEWAEGNYLEPDQLFGCQYLDVVREEVSVNEPLRESSAAPMRPARNACQDAEKLSGVLRS